MTPTKLLIGQALVVFLIIAAAVAAATQFVATSFGFDPALGKPWFLAGETPVYYPWRLFECKRCFRTTFRDRSRSVRLPTL